MGGRRRGTASVRRCSRAGEFFRSDVGPDNTLTLRNVQRSHEDNYSCHAKNSLGTDEITYTLHIQGKICDVRSSHD